MQLMMMADDFTGANDSGVQLAKDGFKTIVLKEVGQELDLDYDVVVVDTSSRTCSVEESVQRVKKAASFLDIINPPVKYKKIDSTIRGYIGEELETVIENTNIKYAFVAPAFPALDRTTILGKQLYKGTPVHEKFMSEDIINAVTDSDITRIIQSTSNLKITNLYISDIKKGAEHIKEKVRSILDQGIEAIVFDAETQEELDDIATALKEFSKDSIYVGSAGFVASLSHQNYIKKENKIPKERTTKNKQPTLIICGSKHQVTQKQVDYLKSTPNCEIIELHNSKLLQENDYIEELKQVLNKAQSCYHQGKNILIKAKTQDKDISSVYAIPIVDFLGEFTNEFLKDGKKISGMIATGGETSRQLIDKFESIGVIIHKEVLPGVPHVSMLGGRYDGLNLITKSGAFGETDTFLRCIEYLRES